MTPAPRETAGIATDTGPSTADRRARLAVSLLFLTNGALFANLLPRYPAIKDGLGLSNAEFGTAVAAFPLGAIVAGLTAATLIRRFRSSRVAVAGTILTGIGILLAGLAPSWAMLAGALFIAGAADAITDVAQNSHGLRVQRRYGRTILNSFHAAWSMGAVFGGLMGAAAAGLQLPRGPHLAFSMVLFSTLALLAYRTLLPGPEPAEADTDDNPHDGEVPRVRIPRLATYGVFAALVLVAAGGSVIEDAGNSWSVIYLHDSFGAVAPISALGFVALIGCQLIGRLIGDRLVDRFGQRAVARSGGAVVVLGMGLALAFPSIPGTIAGFGLSGFGMATLIPAAMHAADELPGLRHGTGLTILGWLTRLGLLFSPLIVGAVADSTNLATGLLIVPLAGLLVIACAGVLPRKTHQIHRVARD